MPRSNDPELRAWVREQVASWPPLTEEQKEIIARALSAPPVRKRGDDAA
jgi:hypothetical protein